MFGTRDGMKVVDWQCTVLLLALEEAGDCPSIEPHAMYDCEWLAPRKAHSISTSTIKTAEMHSFWFSRARAR